MLDIRPIRHLMCLSGLMSIGYKINGKRLKRTNRVHYQRCWSLHVSRIVSKRSFVEYWCVQLVLCSTLLCPIAVGPISSCASGHPSTLEHLKSEDFCGSAVGNKNCIKLFSRPMRITCQQIMIFCLLTAGAGIREQSWLQFYYRSSKKLTTTTGISHDSKISRSRARCLETITDRQLSYESLS